MNTNINLETVQRLYDFLHQLGIPFQSKMTLELNLDTSVYSSENSSVLGTETIHSTEDNYVPVGMSILDMDKGVLSSFGYKKVRELTPTERQNALIEAVEFGNDPRYIQERLHYIAYIQSIQNPNPFQEDLEWFEEEYNLSPLPLPNSDE
jgi:hypothetical protein